MRRQRVLCQLAVPRSQQSCLHPARHLPICLFYLLSTACKRTNDRMAAEVTGAHVVVQNLIAQGVRRVFVIPGVQARRLRAGWTAAGWRAHASPPSRALNSLDPTPASTSSPQEHELPADGRAAQQSCLPPPVAWRRLASATPGRTLALSSPAPALVPAAPATRVVPTLHPAAGAKIDRVIEVMRTCEELEIVLCRNEQSAAFMAAGGLGRRPLAGPRLVRSAQSSPLLRQDWQAWLPCRLIPCTFNWQLPSGGVLCRPPLLHCRSRTSHGARGSGAGHLG